MRKIIKVLVYLNDERMPALLADVKSELLRLNELYKQYGAGSIKVTTTGFQPDKDPAWGLETPVDKNRKKGKWKKY